MFGKMDYIEKAKIYLYGAIAMGVYLLIGIYVFGYALPEWSKYNVETGLIGIAIFVYFISHGVALFAMIMFMADRGAPKERLLNDLLKASMFKYLTEAASNQATELTVDSLPTIWPNIAERKINLFYKTGLESGIPFDLSNLMPALDDMAKDINNKLAAESNDKKKESNGNKIRQAESGDVEPVNTQ